MIKIKLFDAGYYPVYKTAAASCADCYSRVNKLVWFKPKLIPLGFALELPEGYEAQIRPRSGLTKAGHFVQLGTIDADYRGEVMACIWSLLPYKVHKGDRVAQLYIGLSNHYIFDTNEELSETVRGVGGFGHTGK